VRKVISKTNEVKEGENGNHYHQQPLKQDEKDNDIIRTRRVEQVQLDRYYNGLGL